MRLTGLLALLSVLGTALSAAQQLEARRRAGGRHVLLRERHPRLLPPAPPPLSAGCRRGPGEAACRLQLLPQAVGLVESLALLPGLSPVGAPAGL
uniref:ELA protein n=1 Tax=Macrostomum lignano TaxID=282301 RepID=A0A1I8JHI1_9PLAT